MSIRVSVEGPILRLTLDRADKKNALTNEMYGALTAQLERAEQDDSIRVVLIDAEGDIFCAGNDLNDFAAIASGQLRGDEIKAFGFLHALAAAACPIVTAVQGPAVGIGVTLLLHSDIAVVAEEARLSTPFVDLGLVPEAASSLLLPARIGHARAFEMFALGKSILGLDAVTIGLANACAPTHEVLSRAYEFAHQLAARPAGAVRATKRLMRHTEALQAVMDREIEVFSERLRSSETAQALKAFAQRQKR
ncbi:MAG TPA: enoyl-CoA hydratase-related protein [Steroidobacteraceae bacterium]|nr:enoyl-CoA hydratase-related protein [Steroidobacteraceae bacterium]